MKHSICSLPASEWELGYEGREQPDKLDSAHSVLRHRASPPAIVGATRRVWGPILPFPLPSSEVYGAGGVSLPLLDCASTPRVRLDRAKPGRPLLYASRGLRFGSWVLHLRPHQASPPRQRASNMACLEIDTGNPYSDNIVLISFQGAHVPRIPYRRLSLGPHGQGPRLPVGSGRLLQFFVTRSP
jgi:hypothetical protein